MLRTLYHRIVALAASRHAPWWLAAVSFAESSFFPIPPDALLTPMVAARPQYAWRIAAICTAASVAGALLGYAIGATLYEQVALPILRFYHSEAAATVVLDNIRQYGVWLILVKGLTPIPFKLVTIACGAAQLSLPQFVAACAVTRGTRFFIEAAILRRYGASVLGAIDRNLSLFAIGSVVVAIVGIAAIKLL